MLIAFEGLNGVGKTTYLNLVAKMVGESGKDLSLITSKPSEEEMKAQGVYDIFTNTTVDDNDTRLKLALVFYKNQLSLGKKYNFKNEDQVFLADRWISSTVVYTTYKKVLDDPELVKDIKAYYEMITTGEDIDVVFLMSVNAKVKNLFSSLSKNLFLRTASNPILPDHIVFISNPDAKHLRSNRDDKIVSRYEQEDIDEILFTLYKIYHSYLVSDHGVTVHEIDVNLQESTQDQDIQSIADRIYTQIFGGDLEDTFRNKVQETQTLFSEDLSTHDDGSEVPQKSIEEPSEEDEENLTEMNLNQEDVQEEVEELKEKAVEENEEDVNEDNQDSNTERDNEDTEEPSQEEVLEEPKTQALEEVGEETEEASKQEEVVEVPEGAMSAPKEQNKFINNNGTNVYKDKYGRRHYGNRHH